ncbi:MAG: class I tRNA ligase family protein, partial [Patescibacteria group bacterium]|nr:class I tRNA ligase family protein [Patescibacteria group bacterium]
MDKQYKASDHEDKIYEKWEKSGAFKPNKDGKPFTIIMPPPNANDPLHVGHAMFITIEDILIRWKRMQGFSSLWLPGTDHAGIETQFVFEKKLKKQGKSRFDYDRKTLYKMIWDYVQENSEVAIDQMKKLGASADWSKKKFTLDKDVVSQVLDTFIKLDKDGLIYRDKRLVNYCTRCGTAFSNLEVVHVEKKEPLYYMKYGPFTLATTRPETKFGDTAIAVHPDDKRYKKWIGKTIKAEGLLGKFKIKVIGDDYVDPEFGTGVVKITPAHDFNDFKVGKKHKLEIKQVIGFDGRLNKYCGKYQGLTVFSARKKVVNDLEKKGLMEKIDKNYVHSVGVCYRCGRTIEPLPLPQFFIKVKPLVKLALKALKEKKVKIYGSGHDKILKHWLKNLHDWNISRQIVWGIRIPVWYCKNGKKLSSKVGPSFTNVQVNGTKSAFQKRSDLIQCFVVSKTRPKKCDTCGATSFKQEEDTFDTWFSSSQWPVVTLKSFSAGLSSKETPSSFAVPTRHSAGSPVKES